MIVKPLRDKLVALSAITAALAKYKFDGVTGTPAIFTIGLPEDAAFPAILIYGTGGNNAFGTRESIGGNVGASVTVYGDKDRDLATIRAIALAVWEALERQSLTMAGYDVVMLRAQPPRSLNDGIGFPGFVVEVTATILKK